MSQTTTIRPRILSHFSQCNDPRTRPVRYPLLEIVLIVVLATICGEEGWEAMQDWAQEKLPFLRNFLSFTNGIPSPDTLRRVVERIKPEEFLSAFTAWAGEFKHRSNGQVCIDGKTLRHAMKDGKPLHLVSAWCEENRMVLSAVRTACKSNEITAIEELLDTLVLGKGDIVTIDAIGCQKTIVEKINNQGSDYVIALKHNQESLAQEAENFFDQALEARDYAPCTVCETYDETHGRKDTHEIWVCEDLAWLPQLSEWKGLSSLIMVRRCWQQKEEEHQEKRYYISSLRGAPERFGAIVRRHWSIENELHWHLDVTFGEDDSCINGTANENLRVARMTALELLRAEGSCKRGLKAKSRRCLRSDDYLGKVLMAGNF